MIMTVSELRQHITTDKTDQELEAMLLALELSIRAYTNNNFQKRAFRSLGVAVADDSKLIVEHGNNFKAGDTLQITESELNAGLVNVDTVSDGEITVKEELYDESGVLITKVVYPADIKMGAVKLIKWDVDNGDKVGVQSETISRHSVTYFNLDGDNSLMGYPKSLMGFLRPYMKARFGQGLRV